MVKPEQKKQRANREVWLNAALEVLNERGVDGIKVVSLADGLGLTSGSFYWHFKNIQDLLDQILEYWENHLTDHIIRDAQHFDGPPEARILNLMLQVIQEDATVPDHAISVWAKRDAKAHLAYQRTLTKRYGFAKWMFEQVGFEPSAAILRGRLMVSSLIGDSSVDLKADPDWEELIRGQWRVLVDR